jgi:hypothetical protein
LISVSAFFLSALRGILIGHYVNLSIFVLISWTASRLVYNGYCEDFKGKVLLIESKKLIENEIQEKKESTSAGDCQPPSSGVGARR